MSDAVRQRSAQEANTPDDPLGSEEGVVQDAVDDLVESVGRRSIDNRLSGD